MCGMFQYTLFCPLLLTVSFLCYGQTSLSSELHPQRLEAEEFLRQMPEHIKAMDESTLRVFFQLQIAKFQWANKFDGAESTTINALTDLKAYERDIPASYAQSYRASLLALLRNNVPAKAKAIELQYGGPQINDIKDNLDIASSMLSDKTKSATAAEAARLGLQHGFSPYKLYSFLGQLEKTQPDALPPLLADLLSIEEQKPGSLSMDALSLFQRFYLRDGTLQTLQIRFLSTVVNATKRCNSWADTEEFRYAYGLLLNIMPVIEKLAPSLKDQALAQTLVVSARIPQPVLDRINLDRRLEKSSDPLNMLVIEAGITEDVSLKTDLLGRAARLAFTKGNLQMAVDLATTTNYGWSLNTSWRDDLLLDVIGKALEKKDPSFASQTAGKIQSALIRVSALQKISLYFFDLKDVLRARETLGEALKLLESASDETDKALGLLGLTRTFTKVDEAMVPGVIRASIKAINNMPRPRQGESIESKVRQNYINNLIYLSNNIIPTFHSLAQKDKIEALGLVQDIKCREIKGAAIFGLSLGMYSLGQNIKVTDKTH